MPLLLWFIASVFTNAQTKRGAQLNIFNYALLCMCCKFSRIQKYVLWENYISAHLADAWEIIFSWNVKPPQRGQDQDREGKLRGIVPEKFLPQYLPGSPRVETHLKRQINQSLFI